MLERSDGGAQQLTNLPVARRPVYQNPEDDVFTSFSTTHEVAHHFVVKVILHFRGWEAELDELCRATAEEFDRWLLVTDNIFMLLQKSAYVGLNCRSRGIETSNHNSVRVLPGDVERMCCRRISETS